MAVFKRLGIRDKTNASRLILWIDTREPAKMKDQAKRLGIPAYSKHLQLEGERYGFGDYLSGVKDQFAVIAERKTYADAVSSIKDKRIFRQTRYMVDTAAELNMIPILFLTGSAREWKAKEGRRLRRQKLTYPPMTLAQIEAALTDLHVRLLDELPSLVIRSITNDAIMLKEMYAYARGMNDRKIGRPRQRDFPIIDRGVATQVFAMATLFNITEGKAKNILRFYGNFEGFLDRAKASDLVHRVKGVGTVTAKKIIKRKNLLMS